mgnify:FL=1
MKIQIINADKQVEVWLAKGGAGGGRRAGLFVGDLYLFLRDKVHRSGVYFRKRRPVSGHAGIASLQSSAQRGAGGGGREEVMPVTHPSVPCGHAWSGHIFSLLCTARAPSF